MASQYTKEYKESLNALIQQIAIIKLRLIGRYGPKISASWGK